jgi:hypothetical protein
MPLPAIAALPRPACAVALALSLAACGSNEASRGGGPSPNAAVPTNGKIACGAVWGSCPPSITAGGTALAAYEDARPVAEASEPDATWTGYIGGHAVDRAGHPTSVADSGYRVDFCSKETGHMLYFFVTKTGCSAVNLCDKQYPCSAGGEPPKIDADAAIAAAFPDAPASTLYDILFESSYGRRWLVAKKDAPSLVNKVDADTGKVSF